MKIADFYMNPCKLVIPSRFISCENSFFEVSRKLISPNMIGVFTQDSKSAIGIKIGPAQAEINAKTCKFMVLGDEGLLQCTLLFKRIISSRSGACNQRTDLRRPL